MDDDGAVMDMRADVWWMPRDRCDSLRTVRYAFSCARLEELEAYQCFATFAPFGRGFYLGRITSPEAREMWKTVLRDACNQPADAKTIAPWKLSEQDIENLVLRCAYEERLARDLVNAPKSRMESDAAWYLRNSEGIFMYRQGSYVSLA